MSFNIKNSLSIEEKYQQGLLPQRNQKGLFYHQTSCRSNLQNFNLSSENRRILRKTQDFTFQKIPLSDFNYTHQLQKQLKSWTQSLDWKFPTSSIKTIFTHHIFNQLYVWKNDQHQTIAYALCYFSSQISHIAYVFYHPQYQHSNLPIRLVLQTVIDSQKLNLKYCYLGRFSRYKRTMPGLENFQNNQWTAYNK